MDVPSADRARSTQLAECLRLPEMAGSTVRVWPDGLDARVTWVAVIEWPVENFVSPNDLVLTTGIGCDENRLCEMVAQIAASGATAVCICTGWGAFHETVDETVVATAEQAGIALIEIPWRTRFSDLSRAIIGALYGGDADNAGGLSATFTVPLLSSSGLDGIANALEESVRLPVAIFDATLAKVGTGVRGRDWLACGNAEVELLEGLSAHANTVEAGDAAESTPVRLASGEPCALRPVAVGSGVLGWLVLTGVDAEQLAESDRAAVTYAATATAIELLRKAAEEQVESRGREQFLWEVSRGSINTLQELVARAALLGLPVGTEYTVGVGLLESASGAKPDPATMRAAVARLRRELTHPNSMVAISEREILLCTCGDQDSRAALDGKLPTRLGSFEVTFGYAAGRHNLTALADAAAQARLVLGIVRTLHGLGTSGRAEHLQVYLLLQRLVEDPGARQLVDQTLGPLEEADSARNSQLMRTLSTYLASGGNIAAAARSLYLNRHSLMYRLHKITELTGLDVNEPAERLMLDIAIKLRQLQTVGP